MPVDTFHMKSNHKGTDAYCGYHCNPARFPELMDGNKWRFNSSAAEMVNSWFDGFSSMVREMREDRYDFFLDEMVKQCNSTTVVDLDNRSCHPYLIPCNYLLEGVHQ